LINPIKLHGKWKIGIALDKHIKNSEFLGYDEYGNPNFHTERTELVELLFQIKYRNDTSKITVVCDIVSNFIKDHILKSNSIDCIASIPSSKKRALQPVEEIASRVGKRLNILYCKDLFIKNKQTSQLKNLTYDEKRKELADAIVFNSQYTMYRNILLIDDLYASGITAGACVKSIFKENKDINVFFIAMTKTKN